MPDLDTMLRTYFDEIAPEVQAESVMFGERPVRPRAAPRLVRGLAVAAVAAMVTVLVVGGALFMFMGGGEDLTVADSVTTLAPGTTAATVTTTEAPTTTSLASAGPDVLADQMFAAYAGSNPAAWRALQAPDSPVFDPLPWEWLDDYDGDGVTTNADRLQFEIALHGAMSFRFEWACEAESANTARCVVTMSDVFHALAAVEWGDGVFPPPFTLLETFADGLWIGEECVDCADSDVRPFLDLAGSMRSHGLVDYEAWILRNHPDRHPQVFDRPGVHELAGTSDDLDWVVLPSAIPVHEELLPEYLASVGADVLPTVTTGQQ